LIFALRDSAEGAQWGQAPLRPFVTFLVENLVVWITPWAQWGQAPMRPFAWEKAKGKAALAGRNGA